MYIVNAGRSPARVKRQRAKVMLVPKVFESVLYITDMIRPYFEWSSPRDSFDLSINE